MAFLPNNNILKEDTFLNTKKPRKAKTLRGLFYADSTVRLWCLGEQVENSLADCVVAFSERLNSS